MCVCVIFRPNALFVMHNNMNARIIINECMSGVLKIKAAICRMGLVLIIWLKDKNIKKGYSLST